MSDSHFFRFPHTPHLAWLGQGSPRDDKVLDPSRVRDFLSTDVVIEEKVDGANLGLSFELDGSLLLQNRGEWLASPRPLQFNRLDAWVSFREQSLFDALGPKLILFGEWLAAAHSLDYQKLPDWLVGFDVFDRGENKFYDTQRRNMLLSNAAIVPVKEIARGRFTLAELCSLLTESHSAYRDGPIEGFYLRSEADGWLTSRSKLVSKEFTQNIGDHWRSRTVRWNRLATG